MFFEQFGDEGGDVDAFSFCRAGQVVGDLRL
jgi:hypothetical protein